MRGFTLLCAVVWCCISTSAQEGVQTKQNDALQHKVDSLNEQAYRYYLYVKGITDEALLHDGQYVGHTDGATYLSSHFLQALATWQHDEQVLQLAQQVLAICKAYNNPYQMALTYRTIASCLIYQAHYEEAADSLHKAATNIDEAMHPEMMASIEEQLSLAYAGLGNKAASDFHRNRYLDLLSITPLATEHTETHLHFFMPQVARPYVTITIWISLLLALALLWFIFYLIKLRRWQRENDSLAVQHRQWQHRIATDKRLNLAKRTSFGVAMGILPFVDRMLNEVNKLRTASTPVSKNYTYLTELTNYITTYNTIIAQWIAIKQGAIALHIENFALSELFGIIEKGKKALVAKGLHLEVETTTAIVKADKALTLFMLNTLIDNARKFTPAGGDIHVQATEMPNYIEIAVQDSGAGLSQAERTRIMKQKTYNGKGFGLINCKGIIEKYRKSDALFHVCLFDVESSQGRGSRFFFRLPKGKLKTLLILLSLLPIPLFGRSALAYYDATLDRAAAWADSAYYSNVAGTYEHTMLCVDSAMVALNQHHKMHQNVPAPDVMRIAWGEPAEIIWWNQLFDTDYHILLDIRNEAAVAALALRQWDEYRYNNTAYTQLYRLILQDAPTPSHSYTPLQMSILVVSIALLLLIAFALWRLHHKLSNRTLTSVLQDECARLTYEDNLLYVQNQILDNCLSTIKHETLYYPTRMAQMVQALQQETSPQKANERVENLYELAQYYKAIFTHFATCGERQITTSTFRRTTIPVESLTTYAATCVSHLNKQQQRSVSLTVESTPTSVVGDEELLYYLLENLILAAFAHKKLQILQLSAVQDGDWVRITLSHTEGDYTQEELSQLFYPHLNTAEEANHVYLLCKQIVRDHDAHTGHRGCRINANPTTPHGMAVWFTIPQNVQL